MLLDRIKILLRILDTDESEDDLLNELIILAQEEASAYVGGLRYNQVLDSAVVLMTVLNYRRLGTEGLASQSYSEVSESFTEKYPNNIVSMLNRFKAVKLR